jgi:hypothetical protein
MMMDVFSRKVTAWEVHDIESGEHAANLLQRGVLAEGCEATLQCLPLIMAQYRNHQLLERRWNG